MKKVIALAVLMAFGFTAGFTGSVFAQKRKHTPKLIWRGMLNNVSDVQAIISALPVFDMKRIAAVADGFVKRQNYVANLPRLKGTKGGAAYMKLGAAMAEVGAAARAGDENMVADKLSGVLKGCNGCHYFVRDKSRREKK